MIARVLVDLNLPQVDRLFDFHVPQTLEEHIKQGVRVRVAYGKANKPIDGFVIDLTESTEFEGELREVLEVVSEASVLKSDIYQLLRAVADRQVTTVAELVKNAIPIRSVRVEKSWLEGASEYAVVSIDQLEAVAAELRAAIEPWPNDQIRIAVIAKAGLASVAEDSAQAHPIWAINLLLQALEQKIQGKSTVLCLADFRDTAAIFALANEVGVAAALTDYSVSLQPSKRYGAFLRALAEPAAIVVGNRSAIYAPVNNLGLIALWDDDDDSMQDLASPYCGVRELALVRQDQSNCQLVVAANSRSVHVQRLVEIGYFASHSQPSDLVFNSSEATSRISPAVFSAIKKALLAGPVLIQVSALGTSTSLYCSQCAMRARCHSCSGPLWVNASGHNQCRWCSALNDAFKCTACQGQKLRPGKAGSKRTLEQFGAMLPGVGLREFTGAETEELIVDDKPRIIVATPGAEPQAAHGYSAVVILDANDMLARDTIDATSDAVRHWMNAAAKAKPGGTILVAGLEGDLARLIETGNLEEIASRELANRQELRFPPAIRIATVEAEAKLLQQFQDSLDRNLLLDILGPTTLANDVRKEPSLQNLNRLILRFKYAQGQALASHLRELALKLSVGQTRVSQASGRNARPIKIKMDDRSVL